MKKTVIIIMLLSVIILKAEINEIFTGSKSVIGVKILEQVFSNIGDLERINNVKLFNSTQQEMYNSELTFPNNVLIIFPENLQLEFGGSKYIIKGNRGWKKYQQGYFEKLPETICEKFWKPLKRNIFYLGKNYHKFSISYLEEIKLDKTYYVVRINDYEYDLYINSETFLIDEIHYVGEYGNTIKKLESYKKYGEYLYPNSIITYKEDGEFISKITVETIEVNIVIEDDGL